MESANEKFEEVDQSINSLMDSKQVGYYWPSLLQQLY